MKTYTQDSHQVTYKHPQGGHSPHSPRTLELSIALIPTTKPNPQSHFFRKQYSSKKIFLIYFQDSKKPIQKIPVANIRKNIFI